MIRFLFRGFCNSPLSLGEASPPLLSVYLVFVVVIGGRHHVCEKGCSGPAERVFRASNSKLGLFTDALVHCFHGFLPAIQEYKPPGSNGGL